MTYYPASEPAIARGGCEWSWECDKKPTATASTPQSLTPARHFRPRSGFLAVFTTPAIARSGSAWSYDNDLDIVGCWASMDLIGFAGSNLDLYGHAQKGTVNFLSMRQIIPTCTEAAVRDPCSMFPALKIQIIRALKYLTPRNSSANDMMLPALPFSIVSV